MNNPNKTNYKAHVVVTSDTCSKDPQQDASGLFVVTRLQQLEPPLDVEKTIIVDDCNKIVECIKKILVERDPVLIITVGGTGLCPRDVTPEATSSLYEKRCTGIETALHMTSLRYSPYAALSRLTSGIIGGCLIVNFPGSLSACHDCMGCLEGFFKHAAEQVRLDIESYRETHKQMSINNSGTIKNKDVGAKENDKLDNNQARRDSSQERARNAEAHLEKAKRITCSKLTQTNKNINTKIETAAYVQRRFVVNKTSKNKANYVGIEKRPTSAKVGEQATARNQNGKLVVESCDKQSPSSEKIESSPQVSPEKSRSVLHEIFNFSSRFEYNLDPKVNQNSSKTNAIKREAEVASLTSPPPTFKGPTENKSTVKISVMPKLSIQKTLLKSSPYPLVDYEKALEVLQEHSKHLLNTNIVHYYPMTKQAQVNQTIYRVLAEDIKPVVSLPPRDVSTMDGYVLHVPKDMKRLISLLSEVKATVVDSLEQYNFVIKENTKCDKFFCYQVNTGACLPESDYVVVPTEDAESLPDQRVSLTELKFGAHIRRAGSDINDEDILRKGTVIGPVELSLIFSMGYRSVKTWRRPQIGILSTGDELFSAFEPLPKSPPPDHVVDVNAPLLGSLLGLYRYPISQLGIAKDDPKKIHAKLVEAMKTSDVILITGGASMGSKDWVKDVIEKELNGKIHFGRVNMKPGKPVSYATVELPQLDKTVSIFSLPGNPVSAYVTTLTLVLPFLEHGVRFHCEPNHPLDLKLMGNIIPVVVEELLDEEKQYEFDGRLEFARGRILNSPNEDDHHYPVSVSLKQQSSRLLSLKNFDCLIMVPPNRKGKQFQKGDRYWACKLNKMI